MENASKALIIAGAILLAILIIGLGITVYTQARSTANSSNLSKQEVQVFNDQFEQYVGVNKTLSEVKSLASEVISSNAAERDKGTDRYVVFSNDNNDTSKKYKSLKASAFTAKTSLTDAGTVSCTATAVNTKYVIAVSYDSATGLVSKVAYAPYDSVATEEATMK